MSSVSFKITQLDLTRVLKRFTGGRAGSALMPAKSKRSGRKENTRARMRQSTRRKLK